MNWPPIINLVAALVLAALLPKAEHPIVVLLGWVGIGCAIVISYMLGHIDAARLEIDHLRGATKMVEPAQPVAWLVYLPSIDTQNVYDSQDDPGYVDDVTNHADAEVTPLYEMAATKAEVAPAGEYPAGSPLERHVRPGGRRGNL